MTVFRFLTSLAACLALGALVRSDVDLAWHPAVRTKVEKTFVLASELRSSMKWKVGGQEIPFGAYTVALETRERFVFLDDLQALDAGRPARIARTFETLEARDVLTPDSRNVGPRRILEYRNDLAGKTMLFAWQEEKQGYKRWFVMDEDADTDILEPLAENVDFRGFVPLKPVAKGASWDIDPQAFDILFLPGGDLGLHLEKGVNEESPSGPRLMRVFAKDLKGWGEGVFRSVRDERDVECAVIRVKAHLTSEGVDASGPGKKLTAKSEISVEGEILWDLAAHRVLSVDLRADLQSHVVIEWTETTGAQRGWMTELAVELDLTGTTNLLANFVEP